MTIYGNLNKVKKLTNSSLTSVLDITNINFNNLSDAIKLLLDNIQYDENTNEMSLSAITVGSAVVTNTMLIKQSGITTMSLDNSGRIEGSSMLFEVTETKRQRFIDYPDYPETGVNGEAISTGDDLLIWFDSTGWISLTSANLDGLYVVSISGNIVDNTDPNNPVIDQVQADWSQTDVGDTSYIQNKPEELWERGDGDDSLQSINTVYTPPVAMGDASIATGAGSLAIDKLANASGSLTVAGTVLSNSTGEFEWISSNTIRIPWNTYSTINLHNIATNILIGETLGVFNNSLKEYEFLEVIDIIVGVDNSYYIILDELTNLGVDISVYSQRLLIPNSEYSEYSHAEGLESMAIGSVSHAEGSSTAVGESSHAEGGSTAFGDNSHSESAGLALGTSSHAEGQAIAVGTSSHSGGIDSIAGGTADFAAASISRRAIVTPGDAGDIYRPGYPFAWIQVNEFDPSFPKVNRDFIIAKSYVSDGPVTTDSIDTGSLLSTRIFRTSGGSEATISKVVPIRGGTLLAVCGNFYETGFGVGSFVQEEVSPGLIILNTDDGSIFQSFPNGSEWIFDCLELPNQSLIIAGQFTSFNSFAGGQGIHKLDWDTTEYVTDVLWNVSMALGGTPSTAEVRQLCRIPNGWIIAVGSFDSTDCDTGSFDTGNIVAINLSASNTVVTSFNLHSDSALNSIICYNDSLLIGGSDAFIIDDNFALSTPTNVQGIVVANAVDGAFINTLSSIDSDIVKIIEYGNSKFLACGGFTTVTDSATTIYGIGGIVKFNENLEVDGDFVGVAGTGFNSEVIGISVQENGKILACGGFNEYNGEATYNSVRLFEDGSFDTDLLSVDPSIGGPGGILELPNKEVLIYGKFVTISGVSDYGGMVLMPNNGVPETTVILNGDLDITIGGSAYVPLQLFHEGTSQFAHGENAVALKDGDTAIGTDVLANAGHSIVTGKGAYSYLEGSSVFSSGFLTFHGDTQSITLTQGYSGQINEGTYILGNATPNFNTIIDMLDPLNIGVSYTCWSIEYNAMVIVSDVGSSNATAGDIQAVTGHGVIQYSAANGIYFEMDSSSSSVGTLDTTVSGVSAIKVIDHTDEGVPSQLKFYYFNSGLTGASGTIKIAVTYRITESLVFGAFPSFTITPTAFSNVDFYDTILSIPAGDTYGFEVEPSGNDLIMAYEGNNVIQELENSILIVHPSGASGSDGYVYRAVWAEGSTVRNSLAKFSYDSASNMFRILPIDLADSDWTVDGNASGTPLTGTFLFPATFTLNSTEINKSSWC